MKIRKIEVFPVNLKLAVPLHSAHARYNVTRDVYIKVLTDEGIVGYGATAPKFYITGETQESVVAVLKDYLIPTVLGEDPFDLEKIHARMDKAIRYNNAAKTAIDLALHDIIGKSLKLPVYKVLGGCYRKEMAAFDLIGFVSPQEAAEIAAAKVAQGFRDLKVKVGQGEKEDLARVEAVRNAAPAAGLKVDANQSWHPKEAVRIIREMEAFGVEVAEQPVPVGQTEGLAYVRRRVNALVMADEAVKSIGDAMELIRAQAADAFNIKIAKVGGLYKAKKIAALAEAAGMPCMAGCTIENNLVDAAAAHFFAATKNVIYNEIKAPTWIIDDPAQGLVITDGMVKVPEGPGLGLVIDERLFLQQA
ncbi:MAG: L-Ala-D/L-Glu epimerase [Clostridia bacterium]|nr:L-Ala-D/L-Glu epimerase [Clostridia bacterium]